VPASTRAGRAKDLRTAWRHTRPRPLRGAREFSTPLLRLANGPPSLVGQKTPRPAVVNISMGESRSDLNFIGAAVGLTGGVCQPIYRHWTPESSVDAVSKLLPGRWRALGW